MKKSLIKGLISQKRLDKVLDPIREKFPIAVEFKTVNDDVFAGIVIGSRISGGTVILELSWVQMVRERCMGKNGSDYAPLSDLIKRKGKLEVSFEPVEIDTTIEPDKSSKTVIKTTLQKEEFFFSTSEYEVARVQKLNPAHKAPETPDKNEKVP